jgi:hypothetical protein
MFNRYRYSSTTLTPELQPYYDSLKSVIGDTEYKSLSFVGTESTTVKGIKILEQVLTIAKKNSPNVDFVTSLEDVSTNTHIAFTGRLMINSVKKYIDFENWTKGNEAEDKALGFNVKYVYPGVNTVKNIIQQSLENAKAAFINSASHISYPPQFLKLFNIEIHPYSNSYQITVSISKEAALKALGSQLTSIKKAPKPEAFEPVTPKTRAVNTAPVFKKAPPIVKKTPVVKAPIIKTPVVKAPIKNPPVKLSVAELNIEKELALLNSYTDFNNLSPSDVNEIVLTLKPLTDKVIRNDQFAVYDKKLTPSTDKSGFIPTRLVAQIILLFKQLNKFYDLSDLEPIELVDVISQILPVFNKLPAFKISPKKASFYRFLF